MDNRCVCCGDVIPEGRQICAKCDSDAENTTTWRKRISVERRTLDYSEFGLCEQQCDHCKKWCIRFIEQDDYKFCPRCGYAIKEKR